MIDIFVINLAGSIERKAHIRAELDAVKVNYQLFDAVDGRTSTLALLDKYDDGLSQKYRCKSLSRGQLGCYASHYLLWEKCVELNRPIIVLEDDIVLDRGRFTEFYHLAPTLPACYECIRLFDNHCRHVSVRDVGELGSLALTRSSKGHMRGMGYFLTPAGAQKFLKASSRWYMAVDIYMDRFWVNGVEPFGVRPGLVSIDPLFDSDIGYAAESPKRAFKSRFQRELFNLAENIRRFYHNIRYRHPC